MGILSSYGSYVGPSASGDRYVDVREIKFHDLIRSLLDHVEVDEAWYCSSYADVDEAIKRGEFSSAKEHYVRVGYFEDRLPRKIAVDADWYGQRYPDVAEAIATGEVASAQQHFYTSGLREGRLPYAAFTL